MVIVPGKVARKHAVGFFSDCGEGIAVGAKGPWHSQSPWQTVGSPTRIPLQQPRTKLYSTQYWHEANQANTKCQKRVLCFTCSLQSLQYRFGTLGYPNQAVRRWLSVLNLSHVMQYAQLITGLNSLRIQALYPARLGPERRGYTTYTQEHNGSNMQQRNIQPF